MKSLEKKMMRICLMYGSYKGADRRDKCKKHEENRIGPGHRVYTYRRSEKSRKQVSMWITQSMKMSFTETENKEKDQTWRGTSRHFLKLLIGLHNF